METSAGPRIAVLDEVVRNQIAAGEVIERPASVVKELVENALDAGATRIRVDLEEGGVRLVRVTDDGVGMGAEDLALAFDAHSTSKLRTPDDLQHIASLGFRGEALASMGSVARCSIKSRPKDAETGGEVRDEGGRRSPVSPAGCPPGTVVEVRDLFYNTPARRRFLKRTSTELGRCLDVVQRAALAHCSLDEDGTGAGGVGFVVTHDGKRVFDVEPEMGLLARIRRTFGSELASELQPVTAEDGTTRVAGYVAPPRFSRRDASRQMWFLNGRALRDKVLSRVLKEGYRGFLVEGRQPVAFLQLWLDPSTVDVNVHPAKSEVRLREERRLFGFLVNSLREAVRRTDMSTPGESMIESSWRRATREDERQGLLPNPGAARPNAGSSSTGSPSLGSTDTFEVREVAGRPFDLPRPQGSPAEAPAASISGSSSGPATREEWAPTDDLSGPYLQVAKTYLVRALPDGFEIVDQHALHERLTFEGLRRDVREKAVEIQRLLTPDLVECSRSDVQLLSGHLDGLRTVGIDLAVFGDTTIAVHGLPVRLKRPDSEGLVHDLVEIIRRTGRAPEAEDVIEEVLHSAACRSSIMAGDALRQDEIESLLRRARALETDQTCPHARPTRVRFTLADLEKAFHRR